MQDKYTAPAPARSVLLTIDVQQDFTNPGAPAEIPGTNACLPAMRRVVAAYRQHRLPIVHVVRLYLSDASNADLCRREMLEQGQTVVLPGSPGAELADPLKPGSGLRLNASALLAGGLHPLAEKEWAMYKPRWDAFHQTPLEKHLRDLDVNTVVVVGCNFPNCPRATVYGASVRDFRVALIPDAVSGVYDRGLEELRGIGVATLSSEELVRQLQG